MKRLAVTILMISLASLVYMTSPVEAQTSASTEQPADQSQLLKPEQLDALVSPIALYPDTLLAEILMASTYPLEVIEADRWVQANKSLNADQLKTAVDKQSWDDSVKSLCATPPVLDMMSTQLAWTQQLGNAVLAQQADVMAAVQRLRAKAQANNKLTSTAQQTVSTQQQDNGQQAIVIAPTQPDTIYVPYYDPAVVYGGWPYPDYPPYYWPAPGYVAAGIVATGLAFGAGYALGRWVSGGYRWGGGFNWGGNNINVNRPVNINNVNIRNNNNWVHNPAHRQGVRYANANVAAKFGGNRNAIAGGAQNRIDFRGHGSGAGVPGIANRPNISGGNRPNSAGLNRPSGSNRANIGGGARGGGLANISSGRTARVDAARGRASLGGGGARVAGGGGMRGGGRRSDIRLKHDIILVGRLDNGLAFYRFAYNGSDKVYVGVMAQEVQMVVPQAVTRGRDGYLRVDYDKLGLTFQTYDAWIASGARVPTIAR